MDGKYLKMIRGIREPEDAARDWSVYIVRCGDGTLYTGIAKGVEARLAKHNAGRGAAYTRTRRPVSLLFREDGLTRSEALVREAGIKSLPKPKKEILVAQGRSARLISRKKRVSMAH
jgi:predicted GIY-YIG superfamily endonuclease